MQTFIEGNWIKIKRNSLINGECKVSHDIVRLDKESGSDKNYFKHRLSNGWFVPPTSEWAAWTPTIEETCWFTIDSRWIGDKPVELVGINLLGKVIKVDFNNDVVIFETNGQSYHTSIMNCEPFIGFHPTLEVNEKDIVDLCIN